MPFDYKHLLKLAKEDPEGFEAERAQLFDELILLAPNEPHRERMKRARWRLDALRRQRPKTPVAEAFKVEDLMQEYIALLQVALRSTGIPLPELPKAKNGKGVVSSDPTPLKPKPKKG